MGTKKGIPLVDIPWLCVILRCLLLQQCPFSVLLLPLRSFRVVKWLYFFLFGFLIGLNTNYIRLPLRYYPYIFLQSLFFSRAFFLLFPVHLKALLHIVQSPSYLDAPFDDWCPRYSFFFWLGTPFLIILLSCWTTLCCYTWKHIRCRPCYACCISFCPCATLNCSVAVQYLIHICCSTDDTPTRYRTRIVDILSLSWFSSPIFCFLTNPDSAIIF